MSYTLTDTRITVNAKVMAEARRTSPSTKKAVKPKEPEAPIAPTPKNTKAKAPAEPAPAPTPKNTKAKAKTAGKEAETPEPEPAPAPTPKNVKAKAPTEPAQRVTTAADSKTALRLTTAADSKGSLAVEVNHSFVADLPKIPKMLECTNPFRVFCNVPPGLLTDEQQDEWTKLIKKAGMDVLKYKKNMDQLHQQIANRSKQNLMIIGWVPDENAVMPIFGEERFTYVFLYPAPLKVYHNKLVAGGMEAAEAKEKTLEIKNIYTKHLEKNEHVIVTGRVCE